MLSIIPGQPNTIPHDLVQRDNGAPITAGDVTFYLVALNGPHAGQWWNGATEAWSDTEVPAGSGTYKGGSTWLCPIAAGAWSYGIHYFVTAREAGDQQVDYSEQVVPSLVVGAVGSGGIKWPYVLTEEGSGRPIPDATVWVCTDPAGINVVARATTNAAGVATFYLAPGTYYVFRAKAGYDFENPDMEVVNE